MEQQELASHAERQGGLRFTIGERQRKTERETEKDRERQRKSLPDRLQERQRKTERESDRETEAETGGNNAWQSLYLWQRLRLASVSGRRPVHDEKLNLSEVSKESQQKHIGSRFGNGSINEFCVTKRKLLCDLLPAAYCAAMLLPAASALDSSRRRLLSGSSTTCSPPWVDSMDFLSFTTMPRSVYHSSSQAESSSASMVESSFVGGVHQVPVHGRPW